MMLNTKTFPFFSVVIPLYNKEAFVKNTLKSVVNQTFKDFEVIVVNDGSTDKSFEITKSINDSRIRFLSQNNKGVSAARNYGIDEAKGKFIALLDADDLWDTNYLQTFYKAINTYPNQSVFSCAIAHKYGDKLVKMAYNFKATSIFTVRNYFKSSGKHALLSSSSIVFNKNIIETVGWFDTAIITCEDTDMWIRIGIHYQVVFINKTLAYYTQSKNSLSNTTFEASKKSKLNKYKDKELLNKALKRYMDNERYALAITCKVNNQPKAYSYYKSELNITNLNLRKTILLHMPKWLLNGLFWLKSLTGTKLYHKPL